MSDKTKRIILSKKGKVIKKEIYVDINSDALQEKCGGYWGEHPNYPSDDWKYLVGCGETRLGYWEWVLGSIEANGEV